MGCGGLIGLYLGHDPPIATVAFPFSLGVYTNFLISSEIRLASLAARSFLAPFQPSLRLGKRGNALYRHGLLYPDTPALSSV
jgi:hypothetical protein